MAKTGVNSNDRGGIIFRQVYGATRKLHDASNCLLASGFKLADEAKEVDDEGRVWKTFLLIVQKNELLLDPLL